MALGLSGMYGDLQGMMGTSLPRVEGLLLAEPDTGNASDPNSGSRPDEQEVA
jgi:hypothetical protein